jgi:crotonobetainyl-CoA:carnitine CoA-transferase CaiB-like acyl-CoA transferase
MANQPLQGVRVLEMAQAIAGPFAARTLADMGAEVIKVEQPGVGDMSRRIGPHFLGGESAYYLNFNRNKQSVTIDLHQEQGQEVFRRLVAVSDVVFDAFRPSVLDRLSLTYESLKKMNPTVIACSLSAFGQEGPYRERPGFDGIVQAMGGGMSVTGTEGQPPVFMGFPVGDMVGGYVAALSIASALYGRSMTGEGRHLDISLLDVQIALQGHLGQFYLVSGEVPKPIGSSHPSNLPVGAYLTSDGTYIQVHCASQEFAMKTLQMMSGEVDELKGMDSDPRFQSQSDRMVNRDDLDDALGRGFASKPRDKWLDLLQKWDVPGGPVNNIAEALADPQVLLRNMVVEVDHPTAGKYKTAGNPIKTGAAERFDPPPTLGMDTSGILTELLGYSEGEVGAMRQTGAV